MFGRAPVVHLGFIGLVLSRLVPFDSRLVYKLNDFVTKKLGGVEFSTLMRISSVSTMRPRAEEVSLSQLRHVFKSQAKSAGADICRQILLLVQINRYR